MNDGVPLSCGIGPIVKSARAQLELVLCEEPFVANARELGVCGAERVPKIPKCGVPIGLVDGLAANALGLSAIKILECSWVVTRRSAESDFVSMEYDEKDWSSAAAVA
jgi:hypothetical protein